MVVLDSGAVACLAARKRDTLALIRVLRRDGFWPPIVPSVVVVECTSGRSGPDADTNRFLKTCDIVTELDQTTARRAAQLRHRASRGSAVDAVVVAIAEPGGCALTGDQTDLGALAAHATAVTIQTV